uniref:Uncharacterized protein n=1 Tax=Mimiviridae sp. ChoanoV1 TaxID=2596887 RepID=A0A5B8IFY9_9VIRU|nr:hypothetical protein 2_49 [Mimiviridae sp. ChoanoV1]
MPFLTSGIILTSEIVGKDVISNTTSNIYKSIAGINKFNLGHVNELLEEIDIYKKIEIVESLFSNYNYDLTKKTLTLALNNLHEISDKINEELEIIKKDIEYNKTLYFSNIRANRYNKNLENLKKHTKILDQRLDLFIKLSNYI